MSAFRQDLPPPGGYKPIPFERIEARKLLGSKTIIVAYFVATFGGCYLWHLNNCKNKRLGLENRSARHALHPMILAEKDRAYLTHLRRNRDEEERLMANVPGWIVGTYYGNPIYKTVPADEWHDVTLNEYYAHCNVMDINHHTNIHKYL